MAVMAKSKVTEVGEIPIDWETKSIGDIGRVIRGASPRPKGDKRYYGGDVCRLMVEDVTRDRKYVTPSIDFLTKEGAKFSRHCAAGTLAIVCSGTPTAVGLPAILAVDACIHDGMLALLRMQSSVQIEYLFYRLAALQEQLHAAATHGGTFVNLTTKGLAAFTVAVPPPSEQRAIAEALSDVDELLAGLDRLIAKKRDLKQAAMQQLLTGQTRLPGFKRKWEAKRLGELVTLSRVGANPSATPTEMFVHFSLPAFDDGAEPVVELGSMIESNKFVLPKGALMLSKLNPRIPRIWAPKTIPFNAVCSTEFLVLLPFENIDRTFLKYVCEADEFRDQMKLHAIGTTGSHQRIQPGQALKIEIKAPIDPAEQAAIAEMLTDMDAELAALDARRDKTRALKQGMMQELLTGRTRLV